MRGLHTIIARKRGEILVRNECAPSAGTSVHKLDELWHRHDDELLEVDSTVSVLTES